MRPIGASHSQSRLDGFKEGCRLARSRRKGDAAVRVLVTGRGEGAKQWDPRQGEVGRGD
jgi:hypothetical protein